MASIVQTCHQPASNDRLRKVGRLSSLAETLAALPPSTGRPGDSVADVGKGGLSLPGKSRPARSAQPKRIGTSIGPAHVAPDPTRFTVVRIWQGIGGLLLAELRFATASNYDGRKLLLLSGVDEKWLRAPDCRLDPHFIESADHPVVARFAPTERGFRIALALIGTR